VFAFTTISTPTSFSEYRQYTDFIDGAQLVSALAAPSPSAPDPAIAALETARRQHREAVAARGARAAPVR